MTTLTSSAPVNKETPLQKEQRIFSENLWRFLDALLNRIFDLRPRAATNRLYYLIFLFLFSGFVISLLYYPLIVWAQYIQDIFIYLFNPSIAQNYPGNPFTNLISYGIQAFTDPRVLQYLPIFLAPFFIALQAAASYLADIFELDDPVVARHFVGAVALTGSNEVIRVTQGEVLEAHRTSPAYQIGGPGKVIVDIDSAALFERPDGTPHVIGPTGKEPGGKARLDGFERFRQAIDLRDHFIELRDEDGSSSVVKSRSQDGIPITATDVRFMFSVHRGGNRPTTENPYPFSEKAIEQLIYNATSRVTPDLTNPSTFEFSWVSNMVGLIRGRLGGFMNDHKLSDYLASIGTPEVERINKEESAIAKEMETLAPSAVEDLPKPKEVKQPGQFNTRDKIKDLFSQFAEEFSKSQAERGVELRWIGVGTWKTPIERIPEKHIEAWTLSRENLGKVFMMEPAKQEATIQEIMKLIQDVPVAAYHTSIEKHPDHKNAMQALLLCYQQQLTSTREFIRAKGEEVPQEIEDAIDNITRAFGHVL